MPQCPHHLTQRGNERRNLLFTASDRQAYLGLLRKYAELYCVEILGYCLMTNHVHLVAIPAAADSLARLMRSVQMRYSQYRHALEAGSGHVWQGRYYSCPVEPACLAAVMRYVELNPLRARMVEEASEYPWSSARAHLGEPDASGTLALTDWIRYWPPAEWARVLAEPAADEVEIRRATYTGRPLGGPAFVQDLELYLERPLAPGRPGRPKKVEAIAAGK
jgi:putative transposase